jgi:hypothetical protein
MIRDLETQPADQTPPAMLGAARLGALPNSELAVADLTTE